MSLRFNILTMAALSLAPAAFVVTDANAAPQSITNKTTTTAVYPVGAKEIAAIHRWIREQSPSHAPMAAEASISITTTTQSSGPGFSAPPVGGPPTPLPSTGTPGQVITIISTHTNGALESWTYTYTSNGSGGVMVWLLSAYEYKKGNLNPR